MPSKSSFVVSHKKDIYKVSFSFDDLPEKVSIGLQLNSVTFRLFTSVV
jgi:hypothetical protein